MATFQVLNLKGINTKLSPFNAIDGQLTRCVNMYTDQVGAKTKRWGYSDFLSSVGTNSVNTLAQWQKSDGTTNYLYRGSGTSLHYYNLGAGTGDWTLCAGGTLTNGANGNFGYTGFTNQSGTEVFIVGDGLGSTKHTTDGVAFTNTPLAPIGKYIDNEFGRVYIGGTASDMFWSSAGDGTNWATSGTSDSSSIFLGGGGKINNIKAANGKIIIPKSNGLIKEWDDYQVNAVPTKNGFSAAKTLVDVEGYLIGMNPIGVFGYGGGRPEILSNPIEYQIYNNDSGGIVNFFNNIGGYYRYKYLVAVGAVPDGRNGDTLGNCTLVYDIQLDEWYNWNFPEHSQESWLNFKDNNGKDHLIFGDFDGQVHEMIGTDTSDGGAPISSLLEGMLHGNMPQTEKIWKKVEAYANPGCEATLMLAGSNTFDTRGLDWTTVGSLESGSITYRGSIRGRFLFYRVVESSATKPFTFYGFSIDADPIGD